MCFKFKQCVEIRFILKYSILYTKSAVRYTSILNRTMTRREEYLDLSFIPAPFLWICFRVHQVYPPRNRQNATFLLENYFVVHVAIVVP